MGKMPRAHEQLQGLCPADKGRCGSKGAGSHCCGNRVFLDSIPTMRMGNEPQRESSRARIFLFSKALGVCPAFRLALSVTPQRRELVFTLPIITPSPLTQGCSIEYLLGDVHLKAQGR